MSGAHVPQGQEAVGPRPAPLPSAIPIPAPAPIPVPTLAGPPAPQSIPAKTPRRGSLSMAFGPVSPKRQPAALGSQGLSPNNEHTTVLRRLSALFTPSDGDPGSPRSTFLLDSPKQGMAALDEVPFKDRSAIKVKVVTWNMADALPKGDLSVLLGEVPPYEPPPHSDDLPDLPLEDAHPYHVVVFAAQECPTPSGMPRGLGGTLMKGVGLQKSASEAHRREKEEKKDEKKEKKEEERDARRALKEIRKEHKERLNGRPSSLREKSEEVNGLGIVTEEVEKSTSPNGVSTESSTDSDSSNPKKPVANGSSSATPREGTPKEGTPVATEAANGNVPDAPKPTLNGDSQAKEAEGDVKLATPTPVPASAQQPADKASREQLRIDPGFKRKTELGKELGTPASASSRNHSPFDIGLGSPMTDLAGALGRGQPRGWSAMLEEWLCAGPPVCREYLPITSPSIGVSEIVDGSQAGSYRSEYPLPSHHRSASTSHRRSPSSSSGVKPISIPGGSSRMSDNNSLGVSSTPHGRSMLGQSVETSSSLLAPPEGRPIMARSSSGRDLGRSPGMLDSPGSFDDEFRPVTKWYRPPGAGPYVNVAKERLLGLYISVFVYKGCEHLVEGVDKDFVTTGLAGGRFGNKGGIGVSLNLKGHRLLFVNAHLAAHTERNDARLANIAKIKSELNLNCFLPPDDPRASMEDITDRFDTTFWCGDLNFRVDISLLHAKWLLEKEKYPEAISFDQLRTVMADPKRNPLPGFEEGEITFMPTFKYDVWKSVRATNKEKRRSIRRSQRRALEKSERPSMERSTSPTAKLDFVPEVEGTMEESSDPESPEIPSTVLPGGQTVTSPLEHTPPRPFDVPLPDERNVSNRSGDSGTHTREASSSRKSTATYRSEQSEGASEGTGGRNVRASSDGRRASGAWSRDSRRESRDLSFASNISRATTQDFVEATKRGGHNFKSKTQKLMGILRLGRKPAVRLLPPGPVDEASRRESIGSYRSFALSEDGRLSVLSEDAEMPPQSAPAGDTDNTSQGGSSLALPDGAPVNRVSSTASTASMTGRRLASPPRPRPRLIRTLSGRSLNEEADEEDDHIDTRTGVYDTSKKQRVPSWCDRVLWKTHVIPDEEPEPEHDDHSSVSSRDGPLLRLSHAFSTLSGRMRRRSSFVEPADRPHFPGMTPSVSAPIGLATAAPEERTPVFESDPPTPADETPSSLSESPGVFGHSVDPLTTSPARRQMPGRVERARSVTFQANEPTALTLRRELANMGPDGGNGPATVPEGEAVPSEQPSTPPASSFGALPPSPSPAPRRRTSSAGSPARRGSIGLARRLSMSSLGSNSSRRRSDDPSLAHANAARTSPVLHPLKAVRSTGQVGDYGRPRHRGSDGGISYGHGDGPHHSQGQGGMSALTRFFRDLPGRFHSRVSLFHGSEAEEAIPEPEPEKPRRHQVGEVQVLHYGTIDDAGMRQLEGRSDHRPAIFAAAVYV